MNAPVVSDEVLEHLAGVFIAAGAAESMTFEAFVSMAPALRSRRLAAHAHVAALRNRVEPPCDLASLHGHHLVERMRHHVAGHTPVGFRRFRDEDGAP